MKVRGNIFGVFCTQILVTVFTLSGLTSTALAVAGGASESGSHFYQPGPKRPATIIGGGSVGRSNDRSTGDSPVQNDSDLIRAVADGRNVNFVQASGVVVTRVLPDDNSGLRHQKWYVRLSNGKEVISIYNSDMGRRVPAVPGTVMAMGGEFKMTNIGPMLHWLHADPRGTRPNGYVIINGIRYGDK